MFQVMLDRQSLWVCVYVIGESPAYNWISWLSQKGFTISWYVDYLCVINYAQKLKVWNKPVLSYIVSEDIIIFPKIYEYFTSWQRRI